MTSKRAGNGNCNGRNANATAATQMQQHTTTATADFCASLLWDKQKGKEPGDKQAESG